MYLPAKTCPKNIPYGQELSEKTKWGDLQKSLASEQQCVSQEVEVAGYSSVIFLKWLWNTLAILYFQIFLEIQMMAT